nr:MAG TPA: hypothetical protein [Bacteriophage sp.]
MPTVIRKSKTIAKIKVLKQKYAGNANINQNIYTCKVIEPLKGGVKADEDVDIIFFPGTVTIGSEYVVALDEGILLDATMSYRLSSKNSLFSISGESNIKNLINNN